MSGRSQLLLFSKTDSRERSPPSLSGQLTELALHPHPKPSLSGYPKSQASGAGQVHTLGSVTCLHHHSQRQHVFQHSQACALLLLPVDLCWEKTPLPPLCPLLHAALSPTHPYFSVLSPCLVRNLSASEAISPCFVYTTALVAFGFCYCRETQILYTLCKIYAKP